MPIPGTLLADLPGVAWTFPVVGAAIGWGTNRAAIRLLFRPRRAIRLGPLVLWGLLPKRRHELARQLGEVVERELFTAADVRRQFMAPALRARLSDAVRDHVRRRVAAAMPAFVPRGLGAGLGDVAGEIARREASALLEEAAAAADPGFVQPGDVAAMVEARLLALDLDELERLAYDVAGRELRYIEVLGGVLGFLVGLGQLLLVAAAHWAGVN